MDGLLLPAGKPDRSDMHDLQMAIIVPILMEGTMYGLYVPLFLVSTRILTSRYSTKDVPNMRPLMWISIAIFLLVTSQWTLAVTQTLVYLPAWSPRPLPFTVLRATSYAISAHLIVIALLADVVLTYRVFVVWGRKWLVTIIPAISMLAAPTSFIALAILEGPGTTPFVVKAQYIATACTNIYITAMISFKIWRNRCNISVFGPSRLTSVIVVMLESTAMIPICVIAAMILLLSGSSTGGLIGSGIQAMMSPVIGISYSLLIILVANGRTHDTECTPISTLAFYYEPPVPLQDDGDGEV